MAAPFSRSVDCLTAFLGSAMQFPTPSCVGFRLFTISLWFAGFAARTPAARGPAKVENPSAGFPTKISGFG